MRQSTQVRRGLPKERRHWEKRERKSTFIYQPAALAASNILLSGARLRKRFYDFTLKIHEFQRRFVRTRVISGLSILL